MELKLFEISQNKFSIRFSKEFGEFPRSPGIWGIPQIPRYLGNFPKYPVIWEISKIKKNRPPSYSYMNLGNLQNSQNTWESGEFP